MFWNPSYPPALTSRGCRHVHATDSILTVNVQVGGGGRLERQPSVEMETSSAKVEAGVNSKEKAEKEREKNQLVKEESRCA